MNKESIASYQGYFKAKNALKKTLILFCLNFSAKLELWPGFVVDKGNFIILSNFNIFHCNSKLRLLISLISTAVTSSNFYFFYFDRPAKIFFIKVIFLCIWGSASFIYFYFPFTLKENVNEMCYIYNRICYSFI